MKGIRIVSNGVNIETKVFDENGKQMKSVKSVKIHKIEPNSVCVKATIEFSNVMLDITAKRETDGEEDHRVT